MTSKQSKNKIFFGALAAAMILTGCNSGNTQSSSASNGNDQIGLHPPVTEDPPGTWVTVQGTQTLDGGITAINVDESGNLFAGSVNGDLYYYNIGQNLNQPPQNASSLTFLTSDTPTAAIQDIAIFSGFAYFSMQQADNRAAYVYSYGYNTTTKVASYDDHLFNVEISGAGSAPGFVVYGGIPIYSIYYEYYKNFFNTYDFTAAGFNPPYAYTSIVYGGHNIVWIADDNNSSNSSFTIGYCSIFSTSITPDPSYDYCYIFPLNTGFVGGLAKYGYNSVVVVHNIKDYNWGSLTTYTESTPSSPAIENSLTQLPENSGSVIWNPNDNNFYVWTPGVNYYPPINAPLSAGVSVFSSTGKYISTIGNGGLPDSGSVRRMAIDQTRNILYVVSSNRTVYYSQL